MSKIPSLTDYILSKTSMLQIQDEIHQVPPRFHMFNTGSVEVEVAELLYNLVKLSKPETILETGTHLGVSTLYMALACEDNNFGTIYTYEVLPELVEPAEKLWIDLGVRERINNQLVSSLAQDPTANLLPWEIDLIKENKKESKSPFPISIDFLFLDSEPGYRFDELLKFFPNLSVGGFVVIHDLDKNLGHHGQTYHDQYDWPYGYYKDKIGHLLDSGELRILNPTTPRGLTIGQKMDMSYVVNS